MTTILDVARLAKVSTATVSHVLNGTRVVSPATRERVEMAIQELRYQPSAVARSLATDTTNTVGVIVADITNPFFAQVVRGAEDRLASAGYALYVCNTDEQPERERRYLDLLLRKRVDGLLIAPTGAPQAVYDDFATRGTPVVYLDRQPPTRRGAFVGIDNIAAGRLAAEHLLQLGHQRIGFLARHPTLYTVTHRVKGFLSALTESACPIDERLIKYVASSPEAATEGALELLSVDPRPTALVTGNHVMTQGVLQALRQRSVRCPEELSIVCFDDQPWAQFFSPPLTVIAQPLDELLDAAIGALLDAMMAGAGRPAGAPAESTPVAGDALLAARLIVRGSTRPI